MSQVAQRVDWKEVSRLVFEQIEEDGSAVVPLRGELPEGRFRVDRDVFPFEAPIADASQKALRSFWWNHRDTQVLKEGTATVWAEVQEGKLVSGFATFTERSY